MLSVVVVVVMEAEALGKVQPPTPVSDSDHGFYLNLSSPRPTVRLAGEGVTGLIWLGVWKEWLEGS